MGKANPSFLPSFTDTPIRSERTIQAQTTRTDTERFRDKGQLALGSDFDTELAQFDNGTGFFALLVALFGLALGGVDDGNARQRIVLLAAAARLAGFFLGRHFVTDRWIGWI
jgi:hypothetical protein